MKWQRHAQALAAAATRPSSPWRPAVEQTPRHLLVPNWWTNSENFGWKLHHGTEDPDAWVGAAYDHEITMVTRVGTLHADHATQPPGQWSGPTSSSTMPMLTLTMLGLADIQHKHRVLDLGTGSGYATALLARTLGADGVVSLDVDPYLVHAATDRLAQQGLKPHIATTDATGPLPVDPCDRIVATFSVPRIPPAWLECLVTGGRLVTTITGTGVIVVADKTPDGGAAGKIAYERGTFMAARHTDPSPEPLWRQKIDSDTEEPVWGRYPVVDIGRTWTLRSMLALAVPGLEHHTDHSRNEMTVWLYAPDGSWACATGALREQALIRQGGPQRLWDRLESIQARQLAEELPVYGANVRIEPDGAMTISRGQWSTHIA